MTQFIGIVFKKFSPFFETYNEVKGWLESNGMMEKYRQENKVSKKKPEELEPQVLTMDHLRIGFLACLIVASVSFVAFTGELMWLRYDIGYRKKMRPTFEEKREIVTEIVSTDQEICEKVDENNLIQ